VGSTEKAGVSRMTIVVDADEQGAARVQSNLEKLLNVQKVENLSFRPSVVRDLVLLRVSADSAVRPAIIQLAQTFRAAVVDIAPSSLVLECTGSASKIDALLEVMKPYGILEMGRTGVVAMSRGAESADLSPEVLAVNFQ
jgi:acetolactate synthase-1/3 small subunit